MNKIMYFQITKLIKRSDQFSHTKTNDCVKAKRTAGFIEAIKKASFIDAHV